MLTTMSCIRYKSLPAKVFTSWKQHIPRAVVKVRKECSHTCVTQMNGCMDTRNQSYWGFHSVNIDAKLSADLLASSNVSVFAISVILLDSILGKQADIARKRRTAEGRTAKRQKEYAEQVKYCLQNLVDTALLFTLTNVPRVCLTKHIHVLCSIRGNLHQKVNLSIDGPKVKIWTS